MGPQGLHVAGPVACAAEGVHRQGDLPQAESFVELPGQGDDLSVHVGILRAEDLHAHLVELPEAPLLGPLVPEVGPRVPGLPRHGGSVLSEGPHHRGRLFWTQGDLPTAPVLEGVHLLADHVRGLAEALEDLDVLEHRRDDLQVAR